jgi:Spy/CpxP family protein refolding chaperone
MVVSNLLKKGLLALVAITACALAPSADAQITAQEPGKTMIRTMKGPKIDFVKELGLNPGQAKKFNALHEALRTKVQKLAAQPGGLNAADMKGVMAKHKEETRKILTPAQYAKLEKMQKDMAGKRMQVMQPAGGQ